MRRRAERTRAAAGAVGMLLAVVALAVGCGGDEPSVTAGVAEATTPVLSAKEQRRANARAARQQRIALERTFAPNPWREPGAASPHDTPLKRLAVHDVKRGRGPALTGQEIVYVDYVKTFWRSGRKVYAAWGPMRAEYLELASQPEGIHRGMIGMRPGGRRVIAMPKTISDVHPPDGSGTFVDAQIDVVLRKIVAPEE